MAATSGDTTWQPKPDAGKRRRVDLRIIGGVVLVVVVLVQAGYYYLPTPQRVSFDGTISAQEQDFFNLGARVNYALPSLPIGAHVSFTRYYRGSTGEYAAVAAYPGNGADVPGSDVCYDPVSTRASCAWVAEGPTCTVAIILVFGCVHCGPPDVANYATPVSLSGSYVRLAPTYSSNGEFPRAEGPLEPGQVPLAVLRSPDVRAQAVQSNPDHQPEHMEVVAGLGEMYGPRSHPPWVEERLLLDHDRDGNPTLQDRVRLGAVRPRHREVLFALTPQGVARARESVEVGSEQADLLALVIDEHVGDRA
jgi:hypothetical protein